MRRYDSLLLALALACAAASAAAQAGELSIELASVRAAPGELVISVLDAKAYEQHGAPTASQQVPAQPGPIRLRFGDMAPGRYVVSVYHDENGNRQLDRGTYGIPIESWGFSNNPEVMRRPTFDEAAIAIGAGATAIRIDMH
jgi:uncharacterized protein (DUF2141 family)